MSLNKRKQIIPEVDFDKHDHWLSPPDGVDKGKLKEREENEEGAYKEPQVDELDVADLGTGFDHGFSWLK